MAVYKQGYPLIGKGLNEPSTQTVVPVMTREGQVIAFVTISKTTFTGTETSLTLPSGNAPLVSVQLAPRAQMGDLSYNTRLEEFMAIMWPTDVEWQKPWIGFSEFVFSDDPHNIDWWGFWSMPVNTIRYRFSDGVYLPALAFNLNAMVPPAKNPVNPTPPTNGTIRWAASVDQVAFAKVCSFLDFNWAELFQTNQTIIDNYGTVDPVSIAIVSNPPTGEFKASVLTGIGQTVVGQGQVLFDTVRILCLKTPAPGDYTFTFSVQATNQAGVTAFPVTLTLQVV